MIFFSSFFVLCGIVYLLKTRSHALTCAKWIFWKDNNFSFFDFLLLLVSIMIIVARYGEWGPVFFHLFYSIFFHFCSVISSIKPIQTLNVHVWNRVYSFRIYDIRFHYEAHENRIKLIDNINWNSFFFGTFRLILTGFVENIFEWNEFSTLICITL